MERPGTEEDVVPSGTGNALLLVATDADFVLQLSVLLASITGVAENHGLCVTVLHDGVGGADQERVESAAGKGLRIAWTDVTNHDLTGANLPPFLKTPTLFRLLIDEVIPRTISRVVYLDCDLIVRGSLSSLVEADLGEMTIGAVGDALKPWIGVPPPIPEIGGIAPDSEYFNAGVIVIDVKRYRANCIGSECLKVLASHEFPYGDQDALNVVLAGRWKRLHPQWNLQAGHLLKARSLAPVSEPTDVLAAALNRPAIVHFNHSELGRPWEPTCSHPYREEWLDLVAQTSWPDWEPTQPTKRGIARRRLKKAMWQLLNG